MKNLITGANAILFTTAIVALGACSASADEDAAPKLTQSYDFTNFSAIDMMGVYDAKISEGTDYSIVLRGDEDEMSRVEVSVENGTLKLGTKGKKYRKTSQKGVKATIILPNLETLDVSGVGRVQAENITAQAFTVNVSGVAEVILTGTCDTLDARLEGVGELDAGKFECESVDMYLEGVGSGTVYASQSVDAEASGIGAIEVLGKPETVRKKSGFMSNVTIR